MSLGTEIALIKALGGGASLPSVTPADVGKVLGVNDSGVWGAQESRQMTTGANEDAKYYIYIDDVQTDPSFEGRLRTTVHGLDVLDDIKNNRIMTARIMLNVGYGNYDPIADVVFQPSVLHWGDTYKHIEIQTSIVNLNDVGVDQRAVIVCRCIAMQGSEDFDDPLFGAGAWWLL